MLLAKLIWRAIFVFAVLGAFSLVLLCCYQHKLLFIPNIDGSSDISPSANPPGFRNPKERGIDYKDIYLDVSPDAKIHLWLMKQPDSKQRPTIIFFHGNAGNVGYRLPFYANMYNYLKANVVAVSYRGYGSSTGTPSEKGLFEDGQSVVRYLGTVDELDARRFYVFGRSLGGAVALEVARRAPSEVRAVIVENTFWSISEMACSLFKPLAVLGPIVDKMVVHKFDSGRAIKEVTQPILFLSGDDDEVVPPPQMTRLYAQTNSPLKHFAIISDGTHNESWLAHPADYHAAIQNFIHDVETNIKAHKEYRVGQKTAKRASPSSWASIKSLLHNESSAAARKDL